VIHVSAWEAEAYCRFARRRLPSAAEWELAARDARFRWGGSVWEWTADAFLPYPGFVAGPYADYSAPWFGDHRELRGGAFATHARMHDPRYRNFFVAGRNDVFAGFRTAAPAR
jgi:EgtB-related family protein